MKHVKTFNELNECSSDELQKSNPKTALDIKNEYSKLKYGPGGGFIDLGFVGEVPDTNIHNIKQTYKDAIIEIENDKYILRLKE